MQSYTKTKGVIDLSLLAFALLAMTSIGIADAINKGARQASIPVGSYLIVQTLFYLGTVLLLALGSGGIEWHSNDVSYGLLAAIFSFAAFVIMLHSLTHGHAGINYAIFRLSFVFASAAGIFFLHENLGFTKGIGIILAILAIMLFFYAPGQRADFKKSIGLAIVGMLLSALFQLTLKLATEVFTTSPSFLLIMSIFFTIMVIVYNAFVGGFQVSRRTFVYAPANGILMALGTFFMIIALSHGDVSTVTPLIQMSFLVTIALSIAFFREPIKLSNIMGIVFAIIAVVLLSR